MRTLNDSVDDLYITCCCNRERGTAIFNKLCEFVMLYIASFISIFAPLALSLSKGDSDLYIAFQYFVVLTVAVIIPVFIFLILKYIEYRYNYRLSLVKLLVHKNHHSSAGNPTIGMTTRDFITKNKNDLCKHITYITGLDNKKVMELLENIQDVHDHLSITESPKLKNK